MLTKNDRKDQIKLKDCGFHFKVEFFILQSRNHGNNTNFHEKSVLPQKIIEKINIRKSIFQETTNKSARYLICPTRFLVMIQSSECSSSTSASFSSVFSSAGSSSSMTGSASTSASTGTSRVARRMLSMRAAKPICRCILFLKVSFNK